MAMISDEEKLRRHLIIESAIGTNAMESIFLDGPTLALMHLFESGEMEIEQLSAAIDLHVQDMCLQLSFVPTERAAAVDAA